MVDHGLPTGRVVRSIALQMHPAPSKVNVSRTARPGAPAPGRAAGHPTAPATATAPVPGADTTATDQAPGAFTPAQLEAISHARRQGRKITRAAGIAAVSGWTMAFFAFVTILTGLFSIVSLLLGAGLAVVAYVELRGSRGLRGFDDTAPFKLGLNQIALGVLVTLYCSWGIWHALTGPSPYDSHLTAGGETARLVESIDQMNRAFTSVFYAILIGVSVIAQGCTALYYFTRRRHIIAYLEKTPEWVIEILRTVAGVSTPGTSAERPATSRVPR